MITFLECFSSTNNVYFEPRYSLSGYGALILGEARLGHRVSCMVTIVENKQFRDNVDLMCDKVTFADVIKEQTWGGQFKDAVMVVGEIDEDTGTHGVFVKNSKI